MKVRSKLLAGFFSIALLALIVGAAGFYFQTMIGRSGLDIGTKYAPLSDAAMEIKLTATTAHLWFEEILGGDEGEDITNVWELLDDTLWYTNAILSGGSNDEGTFIGSSDAAVLAAAEKVKTDVIKFKEAAQARYSQYSGSAGVGSGADQIFDATYEELIENIDQVSRNFINTNNTNMAVVLQDVRFRLADGHLFLEEYLSGDESVTIENIREKFKTAGTKLQQSRNVSRRLVDPLIEQFNILVNAVEERAAVSKNLGAAGSIVDAEFDMLFNSFLENADIAEEIIHDSMDNQIELLQKNLQASIYILAGVLLVVFIFALLISIFISRGISLPLQKFQELFSKGADGNLSVRSTNSQKDEIGDLSKRFNLFMEKLGMTVSNIKNSSETVDNVKNSLVSSSEETSATIVNIKNGTSALLKESEKMDINISENVASVEEISANINSIKDQINEQVAMVEESTAAITEMISSLQSVDNITKKKAESVLRLVEAIKGGNDASAATDVKFQVDVIDKIDGISGMAESIQAIAAQTNLLSMNAAIEAAHAGDAGKGFAVVADEIRKLADTSSKSSTSITKIIKEIADGIASTGVVAQKKTDAFVVMNKEIIETKNAFDEIVTSVQELNSGGAQIQEAMVVLQDVSSNIKNAAAEMTVGAQQVMKSQLEIKDISNQVNRGMMEISSGSEEIVIASDEIVRHSSDLNTIVNDLKEEADKFTV